jgi:hypothetical protein
MGYLGACMTNRYFGLIRSDEEYLLPVIQKTRWFTPSVFQWIVENGTAIEQQVIAAMYGVTPQTVSKVFKAFRYDCWMIIEAKEGITLDDIE